MKLFPKEDKYSSLPKASNVESFWLFHKTSPSLSLNIEHNNFDKIVCPKNF